MASCAVAPDLIYPDGVQSEEFFRTASRLHEMQSVNYLELAHLVGDFQLDPTVVQ
jgi:cell division protein ZapE